MKVEFKYDEERDIDCLLEKGPGSNNQPGVQTGTYAELLRFTTDIKDREKVREFVRKYIGEHELDLPKKAMEFQEGWDKVSPEFEKRAGKVFGVEINDTITAYLTITGRFPYNFDKRYFFVSVQKDSVNNIAMHELWHFYTWQRFGKSEMDTLGPERYNDIKEALTVLLNVECLDLLGGVIDKGYPQHQDLRRLISEKWSETKDIKSVWDYFCRR